jgi:hypothetical protein
VSFPLQLDGLGAFLSPTFSGTLCAADEFVGRDLSLASGFEIGGRGVKRGEQVAQRGFACVRALSRWNGSTDPIA